jgi:ssDNA-binding Zn-finger/Zn-ribbon topoisomerase 1
MSGSHPTLQAKDPIARRPCPKCGKDMMISRIMPDRPGYELRTYECAGCGHDELVLRQSELTKSDYYRTKAEGCERKADTARDLETKAQLKDFAGQWRYMAAQAEQH